MILTNVIKVIDPTHPQYGNVLVLDRIHKDQMKIECYEWNNTPFGDKSPRHMFRPEQIKYGRGRIITQWLTHTPPCQTTHWLNRRLGPNGEERIWDEDGVYRDEEFPDSDFKDVTEDTLRNSRG